MSCVEKTGGRIFIYTSYDVFLQELPFGVVMIASVLKFLVALIF